MCVSDGNYILIVARLFIYICLLLIRPLGLQATMFNDASSEFDVLVASDAIGMGLNLNISRIIFSTMKKFDGLEMRDLTVPEVKQIAGSHFIFSCTLKFYFYMNFCGQFSFSRHSLRVVEKYNKNPLARVVNCRFSYFMDADPVKLINFH